MRVALAALAMLAIAMPAAAQVPASSASLAVAVDGGPAEIPLGGAESVPVQVTLKLDNLLCAQATAATVSLSVDATAPTGIAATLEPTSLSFPVQQGLVQGYSQAGTATLNITVAANAPADHAHNYTVTASLTSAPACTPLPPAGSVSAPDAMGSHAILTGPATNTTPDPQENGGGGGGKDSPSPYLFVVPAVVAAAFVARRRQ